MKVKIFVLMLMASCITNRIFAQEKVSLEEAVSIALKNNFDVLA